MARCDCTRLSSRSRTGSAGRRGSRSRRSEDPATVEKVLYDKRDSRHNDDGREIVPAKNQVEYQEPGIIQPAKNRRADQKPSGLFYDTWSGLSAYRKNINPHRNKVSAIQKQNGYRERQRRGNPQALMQRNGKSKIDAKTGNTEFAEPQHRTRPLDSRNDSL